MICVNKSTMVNTMHPCTIHIVWTTFHRMEYWFCIGQFDTRIDSIILWILMFRMLRLKIWVHFQWINPMNMLTNVTVIEFRSHLYMCMQWCWHSENWQNKVSWVSGKHTEQVMLMHVTWYPLGLQPDWLLISHDPSSCFWVEEDCNSYTHDNSNITWTSWIGIESPRLCLVISSFSLRLIAGGSWWFRL